MSFINLGFNFRKVLFYVLLSVLFIGFYIYAWSDLPIFWQKIVMILTAVFLFSLIRDIIFWIFSWLSSFWFLVLKFILVIIGFLVIWFCIFRDYSDQNFKDNHFEIKDDVRSFLSLPTSSPFSKNDKNLLVVPSADVLRVNDIDELLSDDNAKGNTVKEVMETLEEELEFQKMYTKTGLDLDYIEGAEKNWKPSIQNELVEVNGLFKIKEIQSKIDILTYDIDNQYISKILDFDVNTKNNYLYFPKTLVQVVYPTNYKFENINIYNIEEKEKKNGLLENISVEIVKEKKISDVTNQETLAMVNYKIYESGDLYDKYFDVFVVESFKNNNIFYIESTTNNEVQYVTFFAGKCWVITIEKSGNNNKLDDFYKILIPAVFEFQEI
jgi:hypothetical protein